MATEMATEMVAPPTVANPTLASAAAAAILTGGDSRRMGRDKATLPIDGVPMALRIARAIAPAVSPVVAIGRPSPILDDAGLPVVPDLYPGQGPLGGILSAFAWSPHPVVVVVACDLVDLDAGSVAALVAALERDPALALVAAAREPGDAQPLCAAWRIARAEPVLAAAFAGGERAIRRAWAPLARSTFEVVGWHLHNVNAPADVPSRYGNS
jgi:molybdopterin-guanine dinucleotide biosynthesis protein A